MNQAPSLDPKIDKDYTEKLAAFDKSVRGAIAVSRKAAGHKTDNRTWWASIIFTRLCTMSVTLLCILPRNSFSKMSFEHWDFASVASLVRNLAECYFTFFYLCIETISDDEWQARRALMHLHDCTSRIQLFRAMGSLEENERKQFEVQQDELRGRLMKTKFFSSLPEKRRADLLKGNAECFFNQDEILTRMGESTADFRSLYHLFSAQAHSKPLAYHRMREDGRGRGVENDVEKGYTAIAIEMGEKFLSKATRQMVDLFGASGIKIDIP